MARMMDRESIPGSKWWRFDFHCHTPASGDFGAGFGSDDQFADLGPKEWLVAAMASGCDCFAVCDHNSGAWIDSLKEELQRLRDEAAEGYKPIHLFPGVEISVNGNVHVLAIFDPSHGGDKIASLLGAAGYEGTLGVSDACTTKSFSDVVAEIHRLGGLAIPAHVDKAKGMFEEMTGQTRMALPSTTFLSE